MSGFSRYYRFADLTFRITGNEAQMFREDGVLAAFRVEESPWDHSVCYEIVDSLPMPEGERVYRGPRIQVFHREDTQVICQGAAAGLPAGAYAHIRRSGNHSLVQVLRRQVPDRINPRLVLNTLEAEHHIVAGGGFLLHASFIRWKDRGILFTAPSGTGKSTQAALWKQYRGAEIINGDRVAVTIEDGTVMAHGIPFCGTSGICRNEKLPVAAIVCLDQAPNSEVCPIRGVQAFRSLWEGCSVQLWNREDTDLCSRTVMEALKNTQIVHLACTPDEQAVWVLEAYLRKEGQIHGSEKQ